MDSSLSEGLSVTLFERASPPWAFGSDRFGRLRRLLRGYDSLAAAVLEVSACVCVCVCMCVCIVSMLFGNISFLLVPSCLHPFLL